MFFDSCAATLVQNNYLFKNQVNATAITKKEIEKKEKTKTKHIRLGLKN